ncbi:substrate-binding domain-containing protein [Stenotrophomonas maltophilia]|uniref:substrate-binding domain-containing protein n=1 Tax=Stenotrophomonas maltophilia TaxID=40324 RepID=UPI0012AF0CA5|nr:substrate-binding domain-containing protein [Stenotrophomonas maltophilia]ELC7366847.1 substrate-binding domain-containing protein [Stenotrophomonas maltophilia]MBA0250424.1 alkaline phosphatase [Stenotrophomonas maltophilia]MBA0320918.1 alkaline phosphatase [Stenotrophomonas maltophilia]MBH1633450.1 substrate-binding domain-containing protein [Stenotrophomonas maltophilia]MCU1141971.1 substrate-binding domain-containing protein [Stenotrophomonas maltophilia]
MNLLLKAFWLASCVLVGTLEADAQILVQGGGATMPAALYQGSPDSILPTSFSYVPTSSGVGKRAFLSNDPSLFSTTGTVHFAGSDAVLSSTELYSYNSTFNRAGDPTRYGALIQIPVALAPVIIPFNKPGSAIDLSVTRICGIFSGKITNWSTIDSARTGTIRVVYRGESSGATELLARFLTSACQPADVSGTTLKLTNGVPAFSVQSTFANLFTSVPENFVAAPASGDAAVYAAIFTTVGTIGYTGPDLSLDLSDATRVAQVKGFSPKDVSTQATLDNVPPPAGAAAENPANWVPWFGNPSSGYPIVGTTNLLFGQCYKDVLLAARVRGALSRLYGSVVVNGVEQGPNDAAIGAHNFIPLNKAWRDAIRMRFVAASNPAALNNPGTCSGIGRPL